MGEPRGEIGLHHRDRHSAVQDHENYALKSCRHSSVHHLCCRIHLFGLSDSVDRSCSYVEALWRRSSLSVAITCHGRASRLESQG
jgi:hypothetical protein